MIDHTMERLYRRIVSCFGLGRVTTSRDGAGTHLAQVSFGDSNVTDVRDNTPLMQHWGLASRPKAGADAVVVFLGGNRGNGVVIATGDRRFWLKGLAEGEVALYDDQGQKVHLTRNGIVIDGAGKPITIQNTPKVRMVTDLEVTGDVKAGADGAAISLLHHKHGQVQPGGGQSGEPV